VRNLSIKLYRIYVCYMNIMFITLYIAFGTIHSFTLPRWVLERIIRGYGGPPVCTFITTNFQTARYR